MKLSKIIIDADFCIKIGVSPKHRFLERMLPELANKAYIHKTVYGEVMSPICAKEQLDFLKEKGFLIVLDENSLSSFEKIIYMGAYQSLAEVMINPRQPRKNQGEVCSLAMAKTKSIPFFITDEKNLQPIIDKKLNTGMADIVCVRIEDVIKRIRDGELESIKRKEAKALWRMAGKEVSIFEESIWPLTILV